MKQEGNFYDDSQNDKGVSGSKSFLSREIFVQQNRKKRRMHTNSILNELRLNEKINQDNYLEQQQRSLKKFQNSRKSFMNGFKNRNRMSEFNTNMDDNLTSLRVSNFCEYQNKPLISAQIVSNLANQSRRSQQDQHLQRNDKKAIEKKQFIIHEGKKKNKKSAKQPKNFILSSINNKLREIDIISRTFDKVNEFYAIDYGTGIQNYKSKSSQSFKLLKDFESKLALRKNMITQRKTSLKKNIKLQYRYKVTPKRYQTQAPDKQNYQQLSKYQGVWHQDARKLKKYISGGYTDEKEEYSDFCDIEEYRNLKKNFRTFEQIYNSIREDKDNPIGKVPKNEFKRPNILQIVSVMEKQQQLDKFKPV